MGCFSTLNQELQLKGASLLNKSQAGCPYSCQCSQVCIPGIGSASCSLDINATTAQAKALPGQNLLL